MAPVRLMTQHFESRIALDRYYLSRGYCLADIVRKLNAGAVVVGRPPMEPGDELGKEEGRYVIERIVRHEMG